MRVKRPIFDKPKLSRDTDRIKEEFKSRQKRPGSHQCRCVGCGSKMVCSIVRFAEVGQAYEVILLIEVNESLDGLAAKAAVRNRSETQPSKSSSQRKPG